MNPLILKALPYALAAALGFGVAWTIRGWQLDAVRAEFSLFRGQVEVLGKAAEAKAKQQEKDDADRKKRADAENGKTKAALAIALNSLRNANPPSSRMPDPPASSSRPDLLCLDRAEYQRTDGEAIGRLYAGARSLADEGTAATVDLNTAKIWGQSQPK